MNRTSCSASVASRTTYELKQCENGTGLDVAAVAAAAAADVASISILSYSNSQIGVGV